VPVTVTDLVIYPLKSAPGCSVASIELDERGPRGDRRWMLVDENGKYVSLRHVPRLCLIAAELTDDGIALTLDGAGRIEVRTPEDGQSGWIEANVWSGACRVRVADSAASEDLSRFLDMRCRLAYQPESAAGPDASRYGDFDSQPRRIALTDGAPLLLTSMASLADLNARLAEPVPMYRFRPNVVIQGNEPWSEESLRAFTIGEVRFDGVKPCPRCAATTVDYASATKGKEPLRTLATFRKVGSDVNFGMNVGHRTTGTIRVSDPVVVVE
jgi:uncharacterized protein YcbX